MVQRAARQTVPVRSPAAEGSNFEMTEILASFFKDVRDYLTIVTGTDLYAAEAWTPEEEGGGLSL